MVLDAKNEEGDVLLVDSGHADEFVITLLTEVAALKDVASAEALWKASQLSADAFGVQASDAEAAGLGFLTA